MRTRELAALALVCAVFAVGGGVAVAQTPDAARALDEQLATLERTRAMVDTSVEDKRGVLRERARAAYKALRASAGATLPPWMPAELRAETLRHRALLRRVLRLEVAEWQALVREQTLLSEAHAELSAERARADAVTVPERGSLSSPVAGGRVLAPFGAYRHRKSGATLTRRGLELSSRAGDPVRAVAAGRVRHVGLVRGLGTAVLVQHEGGLWSLLGPVEAAVEMGSAVEPGQVLGRASATRVYLEVRLPIGPGGLPVDPEPLIDWTGGE